MKSFHFLLLALFLLVFSAASADDDSGDPYLLLPQPLNIEKSSCIESNGSGDLIPLPHAMAEADMEETRLRCASWRFAGEANNLAPWKMVPAECASYVREYMTGKAYRFDLAMVAKETVEYARSVRLGEDGMDAWIFDVDETLLSNLPYYANHGYGLDVFDPLEFDKWVEMAIAPAVPSSLKLYDEILGLGFKIFLLTGRSEGHMLVTVENLKRVGFQDWEKLIVRGMNDHGKSATLYKSEKRRELVSKGYRIVGNSGDQWSDLLGSSISNRSFKLPNPMYYIP